MAEETTDSLREKFLKVYSNLPLQAREETILVRDNPEQKTKEPISWQVVFFEVKNNTPKGEEFLKLLNQMGLI